LHKANQETHIILDNLSAHKTSKVKEFLEAHPNMKLHFTPTNLSTSLLNFAFEVCAAAGSNQL